MRLIISIIDEEKNETFFFINYSLQIFPGDLQLELGTYLIKIANIQQLFIIQNHLGVIYDFHICHKHNLCLYLLEMPFELFSSTSSMSFVSIFFPFFYFAQMKHKKLFQTFSPFGLTAKYCS